MATTLLVKLRLEAAFHVGERGIGLEGASSAIQADTLFGAICYAWREMFGVPALVAWLERFPRVMLGASLPVQQDGQPLPLLLSSLYPYTQDKGKAAVYFLPMPLGTAAPAGADVKGFKKLSYLSLDRFDALRRGQLDDRGVPAQSNQMSEDEAKRLPASTRQAVQVGGIQRTLPPWLTGAPQGQRRFYQTAIVPHVSVDRLTSSANLYHLGEVHYAPGCGLYFLAQVDDRDLADFALAVRVAGENGLGGRRSTGRGQFSPKLYLLSGDAGKLAGALTANGEEARLLNLAAATGTGRWLNLGLLAPAGPGELGSLLGGEHRYKLVQRRGWVDSADGAMRGRRSRSVTMFAPGAVFSGVAHGALVEVTPEVGATHQVYRYGCAFGIGLGG